MMNKGGEQLCGGEVKTIDYQIKMINNMAVC